MPVLLLSKGDAEAKEKLRRAIDARYGFRPPALDTLEVHLRGRAQTRIGPVKTWLPCGLTLRFHFPLALHLSYAVSVIKSTVSHAVETFDGQRYRRQHGDLPTTIDDPDLITSMRRRTWALTTLLLTPLTEDTVEVTATGETSLDATLTATGDTAHLTLNPDHTLASIRIACINPDTGQNDTFSLLLSEGQVTLNELILPGKICICWDDKPFMEVTPVSVVSNPVFPPGLFQLDA